MKRIAVYCGASDGINPIYVEAAKHLGRWLVKNDCDLVYGGGQFGLMGTIAREVLKNGGKVYGILPKELADRGAALDTITDLKIVDNMSIRKRMMFDMSDAFIALPGGPGTLEEISEVYSWSIIGDNDRPCVLYNVNHYYDPLKTMYDQMSQQSFLTNQAHQKLLFSSSLTEIGDFMQNYVQPKVRTYPQPEPKNDAM